MAEVWKRVEGSTYEVSDLGQVRRLGRVLQPEDTAGNGLLSVRLRRNGMTRRYYVHLLVLEAFVGPPPAATYRCHRADGNRTNNAASNLSWNPPSGRRAPKVPGVDRRVKLTEEDRVAIVAHGRAGLSQVEIGKLFPQVSRFPIFKVLREHGILKPRNG